MCIAVRGGCKLDSVLLNWLGGGTFCAAAEYRAGVCCSSAGALWGAAKGFRCVPTRVLPAIPYCCEREQNRNDAVLKKFGRQQLRLLTAFGDDGLLFASRHPQTFVHVAINELVDMVARIAVNQTREGAQR